MNNRAFTRKIVYITLIAGLLMPLSFIARPASVDPKSGGRIADLRDEFELSQGQMTEVDPASETMKLASLGLRGVAVNLLWMQATEYKKKQNWEGVESTLNALVPENALYSNRIHRHCMSRLKAGYENEEYLTETLNRQVSTKMP